MALVGAVLEAFLSATLGSPGAGRCAALAGRGGPAAGVVGGVGRAGVAGVDRPGRGGAHGVRADGGRRPQQLGGQQAGRLRRLVDRVRRGAVLAGADAAVDAADRAAQRRARPTCRTPAGTTAGSTSPTRPPLSTSLLVHAYLPRDAEVTSATLDGEPVEWYGADERNHPVAFVKVDLERGQERVLEYAFDEPTTVERRAADHRPADGPGHRGHRGARPVLWITGAVDFSGD